jgi:hypothetical protein
MNTILQIVLTAAAAGAVGFTISHAWLWYMMAEMKPWHPRTASENLEGNIALGTALSAATGLIVYSEGGGSVAIAVAILLSFMIFPAIFMLATTIIKLGQLVVGGYSNFLRNRLGDLSEGYKQEDNK